MTGSVAPDELLARDIIYSKWIRSSDQAVKQDAFIPPDSELSVTRHLGLTEEAIWIIGGKIAESIPRPLHGRADVKTSHVIAQRLNVVPQPEDDNPNHANITNWPPDKDARKICALEIARAAHFVANPEGKV
ncbi:MAG: hypothetical protein WAK60_04830 [Sedimentisphaerales bacterium]